MAYAASSDYLEFAGITEYDSDDEVRWTNHITRAQAKIEQECKRVFEAKNDGIVGDSDNAVTRSFSYTRDVDGMWLHLDRDLCEISSITYGDSDSTALTTDQYITEPRNDTPYHAIRILDSAPIDWTYDSDVESGITVAGIWAWSKTAPDDIVFATLRVVDWMEKIRTSNPDLDRPALAGEGTVLLPSRLPADVVSVIEYRRRRTIY